MFSFSMAGRLNFIRMGRFKPSRNLNHAHARRRRQSQSVSLLLHDNQRRVRIHASERRFRIAIFAEELRPLLVHDKIK